MKNFYFTFGSKHVLPQTNMFKNHPLKGASLGNQYVKIEAKDQDEARQLMFSIFGDKWSSCYTETAFTQMVKYNLNELITLIPTYKPNED